MEITLVVDDLISTSISDEAYAAAAYDCIDKFFPKAQEIKAASKLTGNTLEVKGFSPVSLLTGKDKYSLKTALVSSQRTKTVNGEKQLAVPIDGKVVTMTESSKGWEHPGFSKQPFKDYIDFITSLKILELIVV